MECHQTAGRGINCIIKVVCVDGLRKMEDSAGIDGTLTLLLIAPH